MLTLLLSAHDGGTAWRHLLAEGEARAGFEPVGPLLLARRVGRLVGLRAEPASAPERLAAWALRIDEHDDGSRSYSASRRQDPFGVARYLLSLRDQLRMSGWDGRALDGSGRLRDLATLERLGSPLPPGLPELLHALIDELGAAGTLPCPVRVELLSARKGFAPLVRGLLDALAAAGAEVTGPAPVAAKAAASSDLGRLQRALLDPRSTQPSLEGDGTFLVLEADTPLEAAELTASLARTLKLDDATVVAAAEPSTLDGALARQGLPTLGLTSSSPLRPQLQVLPLRLALAFEPQDPFRAAELLLLPGAPLAGHARNKLLAALAAMPGIGSPAWAAAIEAAVADEAAFAQERGESKEAAALAGTALRERIASWFGGELSDPVEGIRAARAAALCAEIAKWAGGRVKGAVENAEAEAESGAEDDASLWAHAAAVARTLEQLLIARPPGELLPQQTLLQLHDLAAGDGSELSAFEGEAGRPAVVSAPGAVIAPSGDVVWWACVHGAGPSPSPEPWTEAERAALATAGVTLAAPGETREVEAEGWRMPILSAKRRAVLVRWRLAGTEPIAPHAFFDELSTRLAEGSLPRCAVASERVLGGRAPWSAATVPLAPTELTTQRPIWKVPPATIAPTGPLSASALESLLGCPFKWALHYKAKLEPGAGVHLPEGNRLLGDFAHRILQSMLCGPEKLDFAKATAADARAWATKAFDARVAREAAPLVRRGGEVERDSARTLIAGAAASLFTLLRESGWEPVDAEREVNGTFAGLPATGWVDLVVRKKGAEAVVDLKLSGLGYRRDALESGHALQLALYASLLQKKKGGAMPPSGFFILTEGQLLTTEPQAFAGATGVEGPGSRATLEGAAEGFKYWSGLFAKGVLPSLNEELPWEEAVTGFGGAPPEEDSPGRHPGACTYCDYASICIPPAVVEGETP
ncbi:MAG TPA: PD-(D/E)XK nuclease family protein [Anaeromyxobacteraceae bacterium]|nr:PD-(D/E)XK nuclease family protein [Anaeromyxobacteraceae bacterium]